MPRVNSPLACPRISRNLIRNLLGPKKKTKFCKICCCYGTTSHCFRTALAVCIACPLAALPQHCAVTVTVNTWQALRRDPCASRSRPAQHHSHPLCAPCDDGCDQPTLRALATVVAEHERRLGPSLGLVRERENLRLASGRRGREMRAHSAQAPHSVLQSTLKRTYKMVEMPCSYEPGCRFACASSSPRSPLLLTKAIRHEP